MRQWGNGRDGYWLASAMQATQPYRETTAHSLHLQSLLHCCHATGVNEHGADGGARNTVAIRLPFSGYRMWWMDVVDGINRCLDVVDGINRCLDVVDGCGGWN